MGKRAPEDVAGEEPTDPVAGQIDLGVVSGLLSYAVRRTQIWLNRDLKARFAEAQISPAQFLIMRVVAANPALAQARIAEALGIERARLVLMLDRLEERDLLQRVRSTTDRRSHALHLTDAGRVLLAELGDKLDQHERRIEAQLGPTGKETLLRLLAGLQ